MTDSGLSLGSFICLLEVEDTSGGGLPSIAPSWKTLQGSNPRTQTPRQTYPELAGQVQSSLGQGEPGFDRSELIFQGEFAQQPSLAKDPAG